MLKSLKIVICLFLLLTAASAFGAAAGDAPQSSINPNAKAALTYPKIVLFSTSWCPHCKAAKEYFTANNIPFINRDVELDDAAMTDLTKKYKSQAVPVIVIGNDAKVLRGFDKGLFEKTVKEVQQKK